MGLYKQGLYKEAEKLFREAAILAAKSTGTNSADHITALSNVGYSSQALGNYKSAQDAFRASASIARKVYPDSHIEQIDAVINLANAFLPSGEYDSCEYYVTIANEWIISNVTKRTDHYLQHVTHFFDASVNTNNTRASLSYKKGQYQKAASLMEQQRIDIRTMYPSSFDGSPVYQSTLNNLSTYYMSAGEIIKAQVIISEQVSISYKKDKNGLDHFYALNNLGSIYRSLEQYDSAIRIYSIAASGLGDGDYKGSDLHIAVLNNLGELYASVDSTAEAVKFLTASIALQENRAGINPRVYQSSLLNLGETYRWSGDLQTAEKVYIKLTSLLTNEILHNYTYLSDEEKISFFRSNLPIIEYYSSLAFELSGDVRLQKSGTYISKTSLNDLFDLLLATKGLILHPGLRIRTNILSGKDQQLKGRYQEWEDKKYQYANDARQQDADRAHLAKLALEIETLEKWLRANSPQFKREFAVEKKTWKDIQRSLKPNEAAVEIVRLTEGLVYGALILTPTTTNGPKAAVIKSKPTQYLERQLFRGYANRVLVDDLDTTSYNIFWKPIMDVIARNTGKGRVEKIYISYDGVYHQINLNALFNPGSKKYLIDEMDIHQVTNLKEILESKPTASIGRKDAVLFGRPSFNIDGEKREVVINDLPGTEKEVDEISAILKGKGWKPAILKGKAATEGEVKSLSSPRIVHFATHGFVTKDTVTNDLVNVMLNSGIILAGAGDRSLHHGEDGILTSYEMMNVDLEDTQLVVLSACETGLGEFFSGEGIYGLQRAIRSAGARSVIMSLWKVDDTATQLLMTAFYRNWLEKGLDRRAAFRAAQIELRKTYSSPRYWGAFVITGQ
jgi:CHAT domain-containing protein